MDFTMPQCCLKSTENESRTGSTEVWEKRRRGRLRGLCREGCGQQERVPVTPHFGYREVTCMCGVMEAHAKWLGVRGMGDSQRQDLLVILGEAWR